jgi:hypothetical protein
MSARLAVWIVCAVSAGASTTVAQVGAGEVTGVIRDQAGGAVSGATVTATDKGRNVSRTVVSSAAGVYSIPGLAPGVYRFGVEQRGFRPLARDGIRVETGETVRLDLVLSVGDVTDTITVVGDAILLRRSSATLGAIVSQEEVVGLPLNGRSFVTLASLAPGVALPPASQLPRINGGRPRTNEYLFDGISVLQPEPGQVAFLPVIDAIQELKIESNSPPAEFGRFNGGVVNLTTKSGANTLRGTGFEFFRNEALNARNLFASADPVKPVFRRNQLGGVLGGPLKRNRTFFFLDYQGQRQTIGRTVISTVPTLQQRQGVFAQAIYDPATTLSNGSGGFTRTQFSGNTIPAERMDPVALALLQRYPLPTSSGAANNYRRTGNEADDQDQFDIRIDQRLAHDAAFGRLSYFRDDFTPVTPLPEGSGITTGTLGPQRTRVWAFASSYQRTFSDRWLNELRVGDTGRAVRRSAARLEGPVSSALNLPGIPSTAQFPDTLPTFQISGYQQLGSPANTASDFSTNVAEVADSLSWFKGRHALKTGFDFRWEGLDVIQPPSPTGLFVFNTLFTDLPGVTNTGAPLASFLLGQVNSVSIDLQQRKIRNRARIQEYFIQDEWKVSNRITIAPGLRYTLNFPSTEVNNQAAVFNLATRQLEYLGENGQPRTARELHRNNFGPRLGIVGRPTEKTVLSAGYALVWIEMAGITTPFTTPVFPFLQTASQRTLDNLTPAFVLAQGPSVAAIPLTPASGRGQGVFAVDRHLGSGYVQQWNLAVQRALTPRTSVEVAYVGSKITHVGIPDTNLNQLTVDQLALGSALLQRVPNPYFGTIPRSSSLGDPTIPVAQLLKPYPEYTTVSLYRNNVGTTFYQGLTAKIEQRLSRGLSYLVSYTRSKLEDDASSVFDASILTGPVASYPVADSFNRRLERDRSTGDIPHVFVSSLVWDLPVGRGRAGGVGGAIISDWTVAAIVTLQSGVPVAVSQATNFNAFAGFGTQRANLVGDPELPSDRRTADHWFKTTAFATAPQFTIGTSSRNPVRGPAYGNVDIALSRRIAVPSSGVTLEFRAEVFNLLNNPPLGAPNAVLGAPNFGTITAAGDARVAQLAVKVLF